MPAGCAWCCALAVAPLKSAAAAPANLRVWVVPAHKDATRAEGRFLEPSWQLSQTPARVRLRNAARRAATTAAPPHAGDYGYARWPAAACARGCQAAARHPRPRVLAP